MVHVSLTKCVSVLSILLLAAAAGCSKSDQDQARERLAAVQLDAVPNIPSKLGIAFGDQVTLLGYKLEARDKARPKDKLKITFYWRSDKKLEPGWRLSSRLVGERGEVLVNADDVGPLRERRNRRQVLSPSDWTVGKIYVDEQVVRYPNRLAGKTVGMVVSLRKGDRTLAPKSGTVDKRGNLEVVTIPVEVRRKAYTVPQLTVPLVAGTNSIKLDGKLDEEAWKTAASLPNLVSLKSNRAPAEDAPNRAAAKLLWNEKSLFLGLDVRDDDLEGGFPKTAKEPPLWKRDGFEIVLKVDGKADNKNYYRILVNLQNLVFDSAYTDFELPAHEKLGPVGYREWSSRVKVATLITGTVGDASDSDQGYVQEIEIPWVSFEQDRGFTAKADAVVWANFGVRARGDVFGFSPYLGDGSLQVARRFGKLLLGSTSATGTVPAGGTTPVAPAAASSVKPLFADLPAVLEAATTAKAPAGASKAPQDTKAPGGSANPPAVVAE